MVLDDDLLPVVALAILVLRRKLCQRRITLQTLIPGSVSSAALPLSRTACRKSGEQQQMAAICSVSLQAGRYVR